MIHYSWHISITVYAESRVKSLIYRDLKKKSLCSKSDATQMKKNMSKSVFQNRHKAFKILKWFGDYTYCDKQWCRFLQAEGDKEKLSKLFYHDKKDQQI